MEVVEEWDKKEHSIRKYWLGLTDADKLDEFESYWFSTEEHATIVSAVRDDLVYDFLVGDLSESEGSAFKRNFLASPYHVQMTGIAGARLGISQSAAAEVPDSFAKRRLFDVGALLKQVVRRPAYGLAFGAIALFIAALATITFIRNGESPLEITSAEPAIENHEPLVSDSLRQTEPSDQALDGNRREIKSDGNAGKTNRSSKTGSPADGEPEEPSKSEAPRRSAIVALVLRPQFRGVEGPSSIELPKYARTVRVSVPTPGIVGEFSEYSAVITGESGRLVSRQRLPDLSRKIKNSLISLDVPAQILKAGSHTLRIIGKSEREETLSSYSFEVRRQN